MSEVVWTDKPYLNAGWVPVYSREQIHHWLSEDHVRYRNWVSSLALRRAWDRLALEMYQSFNRSYRFPAEFTDQVPEGMVVDIPLALEGRPDDEGEQSG